ncbi:hypothetical protein QUA70_12305 [Microcoleus sp. LAD1_D5]|uniref:hypothetical protein n=1 Tax=unclassified Microcoleus TaxID=2642155 RepID=UPI002FCF96B1
MTTRTDNFHTQNVSDQFINIYSEVNRPVKPGYLRPTTEVGDILICNCETNEGVSYIELYEVVKQHEDRSWFQLFQVLPETGLNVVGELFIKPNFNGGGVSEPRWPRW